MNHVSTSVSLLVAALFTGSSWIGVFAQGQSGTTPAADRAPGPDTDAIEARPPVWVRGPVVATPFLATSPGGYNPTQIRHAYGFDQISGNGAGQTIAIVDAYGNPNVVNDLTVFSSTYGLPAASISVYYPKGKPSVTNSGWALETNLDVQWAHAIAPGAKIAVVVAKSASLSDLLGAVDYAVKTVGAKQVSMSWGGSEFSSEASYDSHFNKTGVSFFASSGDNGAGVMWPACVPYVVAVGGTTLQLDSAGNIISETAWSGSGGGVSAYETKPSWQGSWQSTTKRTVPDVSYNADPYTGFPVYITNYNGSTGWIMVGGTSAGAPQWAAQQALVNAARTTSLSNTASAAYSIAGSNYAADFRDITSGSNGYAAGAGYDYVTGLGSPKSAALVPALIAK